MNRRAGGEWSEARYWGFIRTALRQASMRWPPIVRQALTAARRPYVGPNPRQKWEYRCACCRRWLMRKDVEVDHIEPCGSLRCKDDIAQFVTRLFCEPERLRILCEKCHLQLRGEK